MYRRDIVNGRLHIWTKDKGWEMGPTIIEINHPPKNFNLMEKASFEHIQLVKNFIIEQERKQ